MPFDGGSREKSTTWCPVALGFPGLALVAEFPSVIVTFGADTDVIS
jgi:hypothetical protein